MDDNDEAVDDQASGWFQVKKKNRRFSIQSWVGGFTSKTSTVIQRSPQLKEKARSSSGKNKSHNQKKERNSVTHVKDGMGESTTTPNQRSEDLASHNKDGKVKSDVVSNEEGKGRPYPGDPLSNQDSEPSKAPPSCADDCNGDDVNDQGTQLKNNSIIVHKFKWGALEEHDLALHQHSNLGTEIKFGDNNLLVGSQGKDVGVFLPSTSSSYHHASSSSSDLLRKEAVEAKGGADITSEIYNSEITQEMDKHVNEIQENSVRPYVRDNVGLVNMTGGLLEGDSGASDCKEIHALENKPAKEDLKHNDQNSPVADIRFGDIKNDNLAGLKNPESNLDSDLLKLHPDSSSGVPVVNLTTDELDKDLSECKEMQLDQPNLTSNGKDLNCSHHPGEGSNISMKIEELTVVSEVNESRIYDLSVSDGAEGNFQGSDSLPLEKSAPKINNGQSVTASIGDTSNQLGEVSHGDLLKPHSMHDHNDGEETGKDGPEFSGSSYIAASTDDSVIPQGGKMHDTLSKAQIMIALEGGETAESKERFRQRLWCFLFENLNRAVDELYLLCELECDNEQMKEAILVLEEAASDFKELTTRVEEFENVKKSASQATDCLPITLKTDHRRPHALSWEVRRMTSSPHRAEILASSLEAFKKIQEERARSRTENDVGFTGIQNPLRHEVPHYILCNSSVMSDVKTSSNGTTLRKESSDPHSGSVSGEKRNAESSILSKANIRGACQQSLENTSMSDGNSSALPHKKNSSQPGIRKNRREPLGSESDRQALKKDKMLAIGGDKSLKTLDQSKKQAAVADKDKDKRSSIGWKTMDAWREKRNWEDILSSPYRASSRISHSPGVTRKSAERARILHEKLMSPDKKKKTALDLKKEAEEKHARAMRIRSELENERVQKLQRTSEKLNRVNEWQAVRSMKLREGMHARQQRGESRHEAYLAQVSKRAGDESSKVNEVRFITSLNEENKKLILRQKLHDSEMRRAEKLQVMKTKQKEDMAREEAVLERKKLIEAEKLQRLAEIQRKKEEAQVRREEERKASSAAREARAIEQLRRKEERAKAQQEEAELLAQRLAEKLRESEQRRKYFLEQIRERASMDFRDQSSPLLRRYLTKEGQSRAAPTSTSDDYQTSSATGLSGATLATNNGTLQPSVKRRVKKIRQRLMAMKYELPEPPIGFENAGIGFRTAMGAARAKISRWLQELKKLRQARKEGAASIGLIVADMIKFLEGKEAELQASRQAGLLDFVASALPASHTSKPEACQVTIHLLKLLRVVLSAATNRSYFLAQNLLPPIVPMLSAALENYIKMAASLNVSGNTNLPPGKTQAENLESVTEVLDGFLCIVATVFGHVSSDDREIRMRDGLLELLIAYQVIHRLRDLFALYDRPQAEGSPFPSTILLSIHLLVVLTSRQEASASIDWESSATAAVMGKGFHGATPDECFDPSMTNTPGDGRPLLSAENGGQVEPVSDTSADAIACIGKDNEKRLSGSYAELNNAASVHFQACGESQNVLAQQKDEEHWMGVGKEQRDANTSNWKEPVSFLLSSIYETGLVSLPSLLTSVLLQANNRSSSEQASNVLPSNFEEVATGVLKVLNNLALLDVTFIQRMLARPDLKMEFFHLMSFLLSHCTTKWKAATDQVGLLLLESLLLLGHFSLFHRGNQAVLRWGKSPTILHKICDLPFMFFSDPDLMPIMAGTLVAACYGCEQNKDVVEQELSLDMVLSLLKSCRNALPSARTLEDSAPEISSEGNQLGVEAKKFQGDTCARPTRYSSRSARTLTAKGAAYGNITRVGKTRTQKDGKVAKAFEETAAEQNSQAMEASAMLHCRFPSSFIDKAEQFFSTGVPDTAGDA